MTGIRATISVLVLAACLMFTGMLTTRSVWAEDANPVPPSAQSIRFDLPAQPLAQALNAYGQLAGVAIMARAGLLDGRTSKPVSGVYSPGDALEELLMGTGLRANFQTRNEVVLRPLSPGEEVSAPVGYFTKIFSSNIDGAFDDNDYVAYAAMLQTRLTEAMCASAQTRPGSYRLVVQVRIGDAGTVTASKLVSSTGLTERDAAIEQAVQHLVLDAPPPAGLPQPITILMRPQGGGIDTNCAQFDGQGSDHVR